MKKYIILKRNINAISIEDHYQELYGSDQSINLVLPSKLKFNFLGNKMALTQFINTWVRFSTQGKLYIYDNKEFIDQQLKGLVEKSIHSIVALLMSEKKGIIGYSSKSNFTQKAIELSKNHCKKIVGPLTKTKGTEYFQVHFDHVEKELWFTDDFYRYDVNDGKYKVKFKHEFKTFSKKIVEKCLPKKSHNIDNIARLLTPLIYELFDNTIVWASTINDVGNTTPNNRSIYFRITNHELSLIEKSTDGIKPIEKYFENNPGIIHDSNGTKYAFFLELSILDSGIGMANKHRKTKEPDFTNFKTYKNISEEYEWVIQCFKKHTTSISGYSAQTRGMGLFNVLSVLGNNAFLKLRSGHLSLYRDFTKNPFLTENSDSILYDITDINCDPKNAKTNIKTHGWAEGTLYTILLPLNN